MSSIQGSYLYKAQRGFCSIYTNSRGETFTEAYFRDYPKLVNNAVKEFVHFSNKPVSLTRRLGGLHI